MKADKNNTTALILAGGLGRRMNNTDKGLMLWQGKTLISHVLDRLKSQLDHVIINANQNHDQYQALNYDLLNDSLEGFKGPLSGIMSGMQYCTESKYLLVVPCDCPTPPTDLFSRLADALNNNIEIEIAIANDGSRSQPLFGLYKTSLLPKLETALANEHNKVMRFVEENKSVEVDFSDRTNDFINFNQPDDMQ